MSSFMEKFDALVPGPLQGWFPWLIVVAAAVGLWKLGCWCWSVSSFLWRHFGRPLFQGKQDNYLKYGNGRKGQEGSWAVVTGGSDGIGLAMCKKLAREGFNICMISRNEKKMEEKLKEIEKESRPGDSQFKTRHIVADFGQLSTIEDYKKTIGDKVTDLDIGMLVLNAGDGKFSTFDGYTNEDVQMLMQLLATQVLYLLKVVITQLVERQAKKGLKPAIVITGSFTAYAPIPLISIYSATKRFVVHFAQCIAAEQRGKIDVLAFNPAFVTTKASQMKWANTANITTERAADVCFRDLGLEDVTVGAFRHEIRLWFWENMPTSFVQTHWLRILGFGPQ